MEKISAEVFRFRDGEEPCLAFIGLENNIPIMLCTCMYALPNNVIIKDCYLIKYKDNKNNLIIDVEFVNNKDEIVIIKNITNSIKKEYRNYSLLISGLLQNNVPVEQIYDLLIQCGFKEYGIKTWYAGVLRVLIRYLPATFLEAESLRCINCYGVLEFKLGCYMCPICGYCRD